MYASADSGIRQEKVDRAAVWSTLLLGANVDTYKETAIEGFENVTLTLVNDGNGNHLVFAKICEDTVSPKLYLLHPHCYQMMDIQMLKSLVSPFQNDYFTKGADLIQHLLRVKSKKTQFVVFSILQIVP